MREILTNDAALVWRGLVRRPFFAVATVVMLTLAIGANAMAFGGAASVIGCTIDVGEGAVVSRVLPYRRLMFIETAFRTLAAWMALSFALIALVVAGLGVYAVNAFIARARLPEFGMRAMLGASPARLLRLALRDAAWLLAFGLGGGALGGYLLIRAMSPLLFEIERIEPLVFFLAVIVVSLIVLGAAWKPASLAANTPVKSMLDAS
ncbi:FtsX-like permease family protein [Acidiphilium acidophilum]|uniref:FtsX-like permease family protein n=1 Tax=Acidiphilium acidophilum TaxID=76588 RepID=UPI002E8E7517|nr:FtsX-like permease family protein [Acidiphilium acidophilum]